MESPGWLRFNYDHYIGFLYWSAGAFVLYVYHNVEKARKELMLNLFPGTGK